MAKLLKTAAGALAALAAMTQTAAAEICILGICIGGGGGGGGNYNPPPPGNTPVAPEIDPGQGLAAFAVLVCVMLLLRERFIRQRQPS